MPEWLIRGNGLWIDTGIYEFRIYRNADGDLRIRGGDRASSCCVSRPARHPDAYTYVGLHWVYGAEPPPDDLRAMTFGKPDCEGPCKWYERGKIIDRTPVAPI